MDLLDAVIDRSADILERVGPRSIRCRTIFSTRRRRRPPKVLLHILKTIGSKGDLTSKVRESLVSIGRLVLFLANQADN